MKKFKLKTDLKVKLSIILISLLILIGILSYQFTDQNFYIISTIIGILILITFVLSIIGLVRSIKNFKRPRTKRRIFFLIGIALLISLILYLIIANIIEAIKFLT